MHLEEITTDSDPNLPPVMRKQYPLPLKHHNFGKKEIIKILQAGLIERSMSPYAELIKIVPTKSKPGAPLAETKETSNRL